MVVERRRSLRRKKNIEREILCKHRKQEFRPYAKYQQIDVLEN
jgi:hypothetical protein